MFLLKKIAAQVLFPVPLAIILLGVACFAAVRKKAPFWVKLPLFAAFAVLFVGSYRGTANLLLRPLETMYADAPQTEGIGTIVVLGGGFSDSTGTHPLARLPDASLARAARAAQLMRLLPDARLVSTGYNAQDGTDVGNAMRDGAVALGVAPERIIGTAPARDTAEEVRAIKAVVGERPFLLVTSAAHMPRAMRLCRAHGLNPVAAPADFLGESYGFWDLRSVAWNVQSLDKTTTAVYECIGILWGKLNRWFIKDGSPEAPETAAERQS